MRWRHAPERPDGQSLTITVADAGAPQPNSIEHARARLNLDGMDELEVHEDHRGVLFVHADHHRTTIVINYFAPLGDRPGVCSINLQREVPLPDFDRARERLARSCLSLRWIDPSPPALGERGILDTL